MVLEDFDEDKNAFINPGQFITPIENFPKIAISFFSKKLINEVVEKFDAELILTTHSATNSYPIYKFQYKDVDFIIFQATVGAPVCAGNFEEIISLGCKTLVQIGSAGCLIESEDFGIIFPTSAIRDEGTSYHYAPPSDEIELDSKTIEIISSTLDKIGIKYLTGKTWTTDGFYRETKKSIEKRKSQGAICVDMECAAMMAVSKFRNVNFAQLFFSADKLDKESYDRGILAREEEFDELSKIIPIALECALELSKK